MNNKPEKLILDYSKWRCGGDGQYRLGEGQVALCNSLGFMCCLGQWSLQMGADENEIMDKGEPHEANLEDGLFTIVDYEPSIYHKQLLASLFTMCAISINDDDSTTPEYKIQKLKALCAEEGIKLEVINHPPTS